MTYVEDDRIAAFRDLVALNGITMQVNGMNVRAVIEQGRVSRSASDFGIDNRDEEVTATLITTGLKPITFDSPIVLNGRKMKITELEPTGERILTMTIENE